MRQFISYPKSGRTWIRYILSHLDCETLVTFHHDEFEFCDPNKPPLDFDVAKRPARYGPEERIIYLERDPHDVMVSLYHQITGRFGDVFAYQGTISDFIRDEYFGASNLKRFRAMWSDVLDHRDYLRISYEDCHADMAGVITSLLQYLEIDVPDADVRNAVANGAFAKMAAHEKLETFEHPWMRPRNNSPKVRRGIVGGFRSSLTETDIQYLDQVFARSTRDAV